MTRSNRLWGRHRRAAFVASLCLAPWAACAQPASAPGARPALTVSLVMPQSGEWPQRLAANGNVAAWQEAVIGAEAVGLRLTEVLVNVGDNVRKGQALARLNSDTIAADLAQAQASLAEARASPKKRRPTATARASSARPARSARSRSSSGSPPKRPRSRASRRRRRGWRSQQLRLSQTRVLAPDNGVISARLATVGAVVQRRPGAVPADPRRPPGVARRGQCGRPGAGEAGRGRAGHAGRRRTIQGRVRVIAPAVDATTRNGVVYVDLPAPGDARAGMFARGEFELGAPRRSTLPQGAVVLRDGFSYVLRVDAQSQVVMTKVSSAGASATGSRSCRVSTRRRAWWPRAAVS